MKVENQESVWDAIAEKWNEFREVPSPSVEEFLHRKKGRILDLGCGSGRNFKAMDKRAEVYAVDFSSEMLKLVEKNAKKLKLNVNCIKSSTNKLPFEDKFFDYSICVAVLHCVPKKADRLETINEIYRTLKRGGKAFISVWGKNSPRLRNKGKECFVSWSVRNSLLIDDHANEKNKKITNANSEEKELLIKARKGEQGEKYERYTYVYDLEELKKEIIDAGFKIESIWEERNVNVIVRKD